MVVVVLIDLFYIILAKKIAYYLWVHLVNNIKNMSINWVY